MGNTEKGCYWDREGGGGALVGRVVVLFYLSSREEHQFGDLRHDTMT